MDLVLTAVVPVFALIAAGYASARAGVLGPDATDSLNRFVVWLALPALLFQVLADAPVGELAQWGFVAAFAGGLFGTFGLSLALGRRAGLRLADSSIEGLDAAYPNTGFLGIPLVVALFGKAALPLAVLAAVLTVCAVFALAIVLIEIDLQTASGWRGVARKVGLSLLRNPLLVAPVLGAAYAATGWPLPLAVSRFTTLLGAAASPCALVTIGLFLAQGSEPADRRAVARLVGLKLLVQPALTAGLAIGLLDLSPLATRTALILAALPTGTGPFMLARFYGRDAASTSRAILLSTLVSLVTISVLVALFGHL